MKRRLQIHTQSALTLYNLYADEFHRRNTKPNPFARHFSSKYFVEKKKTETKFSIVKFCLFGKTWLCWFQRFFFLQFTRIKLWQKVGIVAEKNDEFVFSSMAACPVCTFGFRIYYQEISEVNEPSTVNRWNANGRGWVSGWLVKHVADETRCASVCMLCVPRQLTWHGKRHKFSEFNANVVDVVVVVLLVFYSFVHCVSHHWIVFIVRHLLTL